MANKILNIQIILLVLFIIIVLIIRTPQIHFWSNQTERDFSWCKIHKPMSNISNWDDNVAKCYGYLWPKYCKISYPEHCPEIDNRLK